MKFGTTEFALMVATLTILAGIQWKVGSRLSAASSVLVKLQATYWWLSYAARSTYMWVLQPAPGEVLFDARFAQLGYRRLLAEILPYALLSQATFVFVLWVVARKWQEKTIQGLPPASHAHALLPVLLLFICTSWVGRVSLQMGGPPILLQFLAFSGFAACALVLYLPLNTRSRLGLFVAVIAGEVLWSLLGASKTPILAVLTALLIRLAWKKGNGIVFRMIPAVCLIGAVVFLVIQPLKGIDTVSAARERQSQSSVLATIGGVLQRTDVTVPLADAYLYTQKPWLTGAEYAKSIITGLVPTGMHDAVGVRWTREVKTRTLNHQYQDVSIASGVAAEGLIQGGVVGIVVGSGALSLLVLAVGSLMEANRLWLVLPATAFAFDSALYEGGWLWITESGSGAVQTALLTVAVGILIPKRRPVQHIPGGLSGRTEYMRSPIHHE